MKKQTDGSSLLRTGFNNKDVEVVETPVTERYCKKGDICLVSDAQIRAGGVWFALDSRWTVIPLDTKNGEPVTPIK